MEPADVSLNARLSIVVALASIALSMAAHAADASPALQPAGVMPMPGVKGRIDHLAFDAQAQRLFVAALGNGSVEVLDTRNGARRSLPGFGEPQGIAYIASSGRVVVANGTGERVDILDATSLAPLARVAGLPDADNVRYDGGSRTVLAGYGGGALAIIDADKGAVVGRIALPGHPESFQLERNGPRVFVNVPAARKVVVVDRVARTTLATWDLPLAVANYPMALDEEGRRLFVGTRLPAALLVYDIDSGSVVARVSIGGDTDDIFFDAARKRVYVICGEGRVDVIRQESPDRYVLEGSVPTAPRARTGLFVPAERMLFVAAPADGAATARVLVFRAP